jgi:peptidoglycan/xylan/chitin deacetylase (PgdA/CDA1 family)
MLHHIRPGGGQCEGFAPNSGLEITPEFLDAVIERTKARGYELISLTDAVQRLRKGECPERPFACFTIDDGYRDNRDHALPVFRKHNCPFTIFIAPAITDGVCELWWRGLEEVIAGASRLVVNQDPIAMDLVTQSDSQKQAAFNELYWPVRSLPEHEQRAWIRAFCESQGVDLESLCRAEAMTWDEVREIASDPLCTIGAHTIHHFAVAKLPAEEVVAEAVQSADRVEKEIGTRPKLFAYPYGDETSAGPRDFELIAKAGFDAAVTTRKGLIFPAHRDHMTALPRVSLNGGYQKLRYVDVLLSGAAFALWNGFKRVRAA